MSPSLPNLTLDGRGVVSFEDFVPFLFMVFVWSLFGAEAVLFVPASGWESCDAQNCLCSAQHSRRQVEWECPICLLWACRDAGVCHVLTCLFIELF